MFELIAPYLNDILLALFSLITTVIVVMFYELRRRVLEWFDSRNNLKHQEYLEHLAEQAFSFVEQTMKDAPSQAKLHEAIRFVSERLEDKGINLKTSDIWAAIEKAVLNYNSKTKGE